MQNVTWPIFHYPRRKPTNWKNYVSWKRNLIFVLNVEKLKFGLEGCPDGPTKTM